MLDHAIPTVGAVSRRRARDRPDAVCHRFEGRDTTFAAFDERVRRVVAALDAMGARRVAYLGKNCDRALELFVGAASAGGVFAPINWRLAPPEIAAVLRLFGPELVLVGPEFADGPHREVLDALGVPLLAAEGGHPDWPDYAAWRDAREPAPPEDRAGPEDVALVLFTSGTTGLPKGVALTHANLLGQRARTAPLRLPYDTWEPGDVSLMAMPLAHIAGIGWWLIAFWNGCKSLILREFSPAAALGALAEDRVSKLFVVPAALQMMLRDPAAAGADFDRVGEVVYGAAPMPLPLLREGLEVMRCGFVQCYGLTETTGTVCMLGPEDHLPEGSERMRSAGRPMPGTEIRIQGPDGAPLPPGEIGEVAVRSPMVMRGYWNDPEATGAVLSDDGWLRSGDAGYMDEDGYLYVHDRIKDMIVSGGENVYPAEVESVLYGHPDVAEAAVIGVPDETWGEAVHAVVVPRAGREIDPDALIAWTREGLAGFKCPKSVERSEALPRNAAGKVLKRALRAPHWEGRSRQVN